MAKVKGPLFSIDARGKIADAMVFGGWKGIPWVREWFKPQNPKSDAQVALRLIFSQGVQAWQGNLSDQQKLDWQTAVDRKGAVMSGFNFFMSEYITDMRNGETPSDDPPAHLLP
ncbi:unnamed protein product [marine sediment metagenome]|uniref:Uncharacterized protein n=1 Tax=marine sediment metagenome TaxID=412755 RepID=X0WG11_9ZZZZ